jgi:hypothetical protein
MTPRWILPFVLAGCFGEGPVPRQASGVASMFAAPPAPHGEECSSSVYIGSVVLGSTHGYAITVPYIPSGPGAPECCPGGGMCPQPNESLLAVYQFDKASPNPTGMRIAMVDGMNMGNNQPRVVVNGDTPAWATSNGNGNIQIEPENWTTNTMGGFYAPAGVVTDGGSFYVAGWNGSSRTDVDNPSYPCCGNGNPGQGMYSLTKVSGPPPTGAVPLGPAPAFACETTETCFTSNQDKLFYFEHAQSAIQLTWLAKTVPTPGLVTMIDTSLVPVGLAANNQYVVWAESIDYEMASGSACKIGWWDPTMTSSAPHWVLQTDRFSCMGIALDGSTVYVAIVARGQDDCSGCGPPPLAGVGIGRFSLPDASTFESLSIRPAQATGFRRLLVDGAQIYGIDPAQVVRLSTDALTGAHDFPL